MGLLYVLLAEADCATVAILPLFADDAGAALNLLLVDAAANFLL